MDGIQAILEALAAHGPAATRPAPLGSTQLAILATLERGPHSLEALARMFCLGPAARASVDRLAERGLVERCADPADGRGVRLSLTEAGRALQRQIGRQHARGVARAMTAGLDPAELKQLETICLKLAHQNEDLPR